MIKPPKWLFKEEVKITPHLGDSAYGAVHGPQYKTTCYAELKRTLITSKEGKEVVCNVFMVFRDQINLPNASLVMWEGQEYTVVEAKPFKPMGKFTHIEAYLK